MTLVISTNVAALSAKRKLEATQQGLATTVQRLSSGLRINSAKDDAAGMSISERMHAGIRGLNQAVRNASDGISLAQTAESALDQLSNNLQRIRELAVQAANGSLSNNDRASLQAEADQLTREISRIIGNAEFNGTKLLSGSNSLTFQVGAENAASNRIEITTTDLTSASPEHAAALNMASLFHTYAVSGETDDTMFHDTSHPTYQALQAGYTQYGSGAQYNAALAVWNAAHDAYIDSPGYPGPDDASNAAAIAAADAQAATYASSGNGVFNSYNSNLSASNTINISTQNNAASALTSIDADINRISDTRSTFGALQNRFEAVIRNLENSSESLTAARSRVLDADYAAETAELMRRQILQQAGTSMLAQANSVPQIALTLLQ